MLTKTKQKRKKKILTCIPVGFFSTTLLAPCRSACTYRSPVTNRKKNLIPAYHLKKNLVISVWQGMYETERWRE